MNHSITLGGLLLTLMLVGGLGMAGIGLLMIFAGGMSDAPEAGADASRQGCLVALVGLVLSGLALWGLLS
jgi:hypothetical protein